MAKVNVENDNHHAVSSQFHLAECLNLRWHYRKGNFIRMKAIKDNTRKPPYKIDFHWGHIIGVHCEDVEGNWSNWTGKTREVRHGTGTNLIIQQGFKLLTPALGPQWCDSM